MSTLKGPTTDWPHCSKGRRRDFIEQPSAFAGRRQYVQRRANDVPILVTHRATRTNRLWRLAA